MTTNSKILSNIEDGTERYIAYIRRMNTLNDEQLATVLGRAFNQNTDSYIGINLESHMSHIRQMATLTDDQLRKKLRDAAAKDPVLQDTFEDAAQKKALSDMKNMAKDIKSDARKFARKVDKDISS